MAGTLLGKDQIEKVNGSYRALVDHVRDLLKTSDEPVNLIRIHVQTEYLDTTELSRIFMGLPFLSPAEKRAMVRAAIFDVFLGREIKEYKAPERDNAGVIKTAGPESLKEFKPAQFNLNVNTASAIKIETSPTPPTEAHVPVIQRQIHTLNVTTIKDHQGK